MTALDWIIVFAVIAAAMQMKDALRWREWEDELRRRRPRPHTFG